MEQSLNGRTNSLNRRQNEDIETLTMFLSNPDFNHNQQK